MKKTIMVTLILLVSIVNLSAQKITELPIQKPSEGKSLVYIVRTGGGALVNFRVYDGHTPISKLKAGKYIIYECDPGEHVFWASSENRDFLEANLEANKTYVINVIGQMGFAFASVAIEPMDPDKKRDQKIIHKVILKNDAYQSDTEELQDLEYDIENGMETYERRDRKNASSIGTLEADKNFTHANKP